MYLNEIPVVTREVRDRATSAILVPADYDHLGMLLIVSTAISFLVPLAAVAVVRVLKLKSA